MCLVHCGRDLRKKKRKRKEIKDLYESNNFFFLKNLIPSKYFKGQFETNITNIIIYKCMAITVEIDQLVCLESLISKRPIKKNIII